MHKIKFIYMVMILTILAGSIQAQTQRRLKNEYRKLENYIQRVTLVVQKFNNPRATEYIQSANSELSKAQNLLFQSQHYSGRLVQAAKHLAAAKRFADLAARIVLRSPLKRLKTEMDNLINRAEDIIAGSPNEEARYLLEKAKIYRRKAFRALQNRNTARGQEYYRVAFFFANKAKNLAGRETNYTANEFDELLSRVEQLLSETEIIIRESGKTNLLNILEEAENHIREAELLYQDNKQNLAVRRIRLVEKLLYRIVDQADSEDDLLENRLQNELFSLNSYLDALQSELLQKKRNDLQKLYDNAVRLFQKAQNHYESNEFRKAQLNISLSQKMAHNIFRKLKTDAGVSYFDLDLRIEDAENVLSLLEGKVKKSENQTIQNLYEQAHQILARAKKSYKNGEYDHAFQLIHLTTRLTSRIQKMLGQDQIREDGQKESIEAKILQAEQFLQKIRKNESLDEKKLNLIDNLDKFITEARNYFQEGNYALADEYISSVLQQVRYYAKTWRNMQSN